MKIVILEANSLGADVDLSAFEKLGEVAVYGQSNMQDTPEKIKDADIIVVNKVPMNEQTLAGAENLKMIALTATGYCGQGVYRQQKDCCGKCQGIFYRFRSTAYLRTGTVFDKSACLL